MPERRRRLHDVVTALDGHIGTVRAEGLDHTATLLSMAKLDLQMQIHGISDAELRALSDAVAAAPMPSDDSDSDIVDLASRRQRRQS
jgi:hypothetical protein